MFEKEAEEYATENWEYYEEGKNDSKELKQAYLAGAEFGYNKAFVEADKNLKAIVTDFNKAEELEKEKCELLGIIQGKDKVIQELKKELNKANEWHYPSKGEYPKECEDVLCYCKCRTEIKFYSVGHTIIGGDNKIRWWSSDRSEKLKVYAWKEITPPKEIEENE